MHTHHLDALSLWQCASCALINQLITMKFWIRILAVEGQHLPVRFHNSNMSVTCSWCVWQLAFWQLVVFVSLCCVTAHCVDRFLHKILGTTLEQLIVSWHINSCMSKLSLSKRSPSTMRGSRQGNQNNFSCCSKPKTDLQNHHLWLRQGDKAHLLLASALRVGRLTEHAKVQSFQLAWHKW